MIVVVATEEEKKIAKLRFKHIPVIVTGVGATNVIRKLKRYPKFIKIINFGYTGSNNLEIGTEVEIGECEILHENVEFKTPIFKLPGKIKCYTANDFVVSTKIKVPCVFDMELAYILALGFKNVKSTKIVSDNLSLKDYEAKISLHL